MHKFKKFAKFDIPTGAHEIPDLTTAEGAREKLSRLQSFMEDVDIDLTEIQDRIEILSRKFQANMYDPKSSRTGFLTYNLERYLEPLKLGGDKIFKLLNDDLARWVFNLETTITEMSETTSARELRSVLNDQSFNDLSLEINQLTSSPLLNQAPSPNSLLNVPSEPKLNGQLRKLPLMEGRLNGDEKPFQWPYDVEDLGPLDMRNPLRLKSFYMERRTMGQYLTGVQITLSNGQKSPFFGKRHFFVSDRTLTFDGQEREKSVYIQIFNDVVHDISFNEST